MLGWGGVGRGGGPVTAKQQPFLRWQMGVDVGVGSIEERAACCTWDCCAEAGAAQESGRKLVRSVGRTVCWAGWPRCMGQSVIGDGNEG